MPKALEEKLKREAMKKFGSTTSEKARAYIWGTLSKIYPSWNPYRGGKK